MLSICCFVRRRKVQIVTAVLAWLVFDQRVALGATNELTNFDRRQGGPQPGRLAANAATENAATALRQRLHDLRIAKDEILASPKWVASTREFLTGTNGAGGAVSAQTAAVVAPTEPHRGVKTFLTEHQALFGFGPEALATAKVRQDYVSPAGGFRTTIWQQHLDDVPVFEALFKAHLTKHGELINVGSQFVPDLPGAAAKVANRAQLQSAPAVSAPQAIVFAAANIGDQVSAKQIAALAAPQGTEKFQHFTAPPVLNHASARLTWLPLDAATVRLCWEINLVSRARGEGFQVLVDAQTGEVWVRRCFTEHISTAQYNVFTSDSPSPFSPGWSAPFTNQPALVARTLVTVSALSPAASPNGWINDGDNTTAGNNADAHLDRDNDDGADDGSRPTGSPFRVFDYPLNLAQAPATYTNAAVVNLFYWNNWMHDQLYAFGFDEAAGNFQNERFGRGGFPGTAVQADAQDASVSDSQSVPPDPQFNNANFTTLPDGTPPRMQMYLYNHAAPNRDASLDADVVCHEYAHGLSSRLVGGGTGISALQTRGMGEGWSDFYSLSLLSDPSDNPNAVYAWAAYTTLRTNFLQNYYFGVRRYPYTTDLSKNPLTFKDVDPAQASAHAGVLLNPLFTTVYANQADEVHSIGEVWCALLWEARARLIARLGAATGNAQMLQLVTDGMKLGSSNPSFIEARDAIMQADLVLTGGANLDDLWTAFAKRGLGFSASNPGVSTTAGVVEAFDVPSVANFPVVTIASPTEQSFHQSLATASGTASSTVNAVFLFLQRTSDNFYYNPTNSTWEAGPAVIVASGLANWSATLPSLPDGNYLLTARTTDGVAISDRAFRYFNIDNSTPALAISSPTNNSALTAPPTVTGGVTDNYYINEVRVVLNRASDGAWYNFASNTWGTTVFDFARNVRFATVVFTNWTAPLPALADGGYQVQAQAVDRAANATAWITRNFTLDNGAPAVTFSPLTNQQVVFDFAQLGGTISEAGTVAFKIEWFRAGGNEFWNGVNWSSDGSDANALLPADVAGLAWTPAGGTLPSRAQTSQGNYLIHAHVTDPAGNTNYNNLVLARSPLDTTPPLVSINLFEDEVFTNNFLPPLQGLAGDAESGVDLVTLYFARRVAGDFEYWDGSSWSATPSPITLSYQNFLWEMPGGAPQPSGANLRNGSYNIQTIARNRENPALSGSVSVNFIVDYHPVYVWTAGSYSDLNPNNNNMNWDNPANWDVGQVPTADAIVIITGYTPDNTALGSVPLYRLDLSGGTLTTSGMLIQKLNLSGGALTGGALALATNGVFNWSGGTISGACVIPAGATVNVSGATAKTLGAGTVLDNSGTINWAGPGVIYNYGYNAGDRATINNQSNAVFNLTTDGQVFAHDYNESMFYNLTGAQLIKSGGTNAAAFNNFVLFNSGELRVDSGAILFDGTCTFSPGTTLAGAGAVRLLGASAIQCPVPGTANLRLEAGNLTASGPAAYGGSAGMDWTGGTLAGALEIAPGSELRISGAATKHLGGGAVLNNRGAITWSGPGAIYNYGYNFGDRATINNLDAATFTLLTDGQVFAHDYGASWFHNQAGAQFRKTAGAGTALVNHFIFNNAGEINAATGTLEFNDTLNLGGGGMLTGAGQFLISGGLTTLSNLTTIAGPAVTMTAGTLLGDAASNGGLATTNGGSFDWAGGTQLGTVNLAPGTTFNISSAAQKTMGSGAVLNNAGSVTWGGSGNIYNYGYNLGDRAAINNLSGATFNVTSNAAFAYDYNPSAINNASNATFAKIDGGGGTTCHWLFNNAGAATCTSGTLTLAGGGNSGGSFEAGPDALVRFTGGTHSLSNGSRFAGSGCVQIDGATVLHDGALTLGSPAQPLACDLLTGVLGGNGTLPGNYVLTWTGGTIAGNQTITADGAMVVTNSGNKTLGSGAVLNNQGAITWFGPGTIFNNGYNFGDVATINNQSNAQFIAAADGPVFFHDYNLSLFNNLPGARFTKSAGTNATSINHFVFNSPGEVRVEAGSLLFDFLATFGPGGSLTGSGTVRWAGDIRLAGGVDSAVNVSLEAGTLTGISNATYSGPGPLNWTAGALAGTTTIAPGSTLNLAGGGKTLASGAVLNNQGVVNWSGPGALYNYGYNAGDRATFNNLAGGVFNLATNGAVFSYDYNVSLLNNAPGARLRKTGGTGSASISYTFANSGVIEVLAGTLNFNGSYASAAATAELDLILGGATPGTEFTRLTADGNLPLAGALNVTLADGFTPTNGESFAVVGYGARTGTFQSISLPALPGGWEWQTRYEPNALTVRSRVIPDCLNLTNGLVAWWPGEGGTNLLGTGDVAPANGATNGPGLNGSAFQLDGINDYWSVPDSTNFQPANLTVEGWVSFNGYGGLRTLFGKPYGNSYFDSFSVWLQDTTLHGVITTPGGFSPILSFALTPQPGRWYHIAFTFDDTNDVQTLYLDGLAVASSAAAGPIVYDTRPFVIGADIENGSYDFFHNGAIDEVTLYHRALSSAEISAIYATDSVGRCPLPAPAAPNVQLSNPVWTNGGLQAVITAPASAAVIVEASDDLQTWTPVQTNTPFTGVFLFNDPAAVAHPQRFYRIRLEP